jgi:hypothetical protein
MEFKMRPTDPTPSLPSLKILQDELEQYRKTGRAVHLAHAARALGDLRMELQTYAKCEQGGPVADTRSIAA